MIKIGVTSDIHLGFINKKQISEFALNIAEKQYNILVITGDISDYPAFSRDIITISNIIKIPIMFVLGNHDYYHGGISKANNLAKILTKRSLTIKFLPDAPPISITDNVCIIGCNGQADCGYGNPNMVQFQINDFQCIEEFKELNWDLPAIWGRMRQIAKKEASRLEKKLKLINTESIKDLVVITHVPPFAEACWHKGEPSPLALPYFANKSVGDVLTEFADRNKKIQISVFCGHTHEQRVHSNKNITTYVLGAEYGDPKIGYEIIIDKKIKVKQC